MLSCAGDYHFHIKTAIGWREGLSIDCAGESARPAKPGINPEGAVNTL
jgi:hypothetical protein